MKLLICHDCGDIFNLQLHLKTCSCGKVKGKYINNSEAVVNGEGTSLAMGNGSIYKAITRIHLVTEDFRDTGDLWRRHETSIICWARQHSGPTNSHTIVDPSL